MPGFSPAAGRQSLVFGTYPRVKAFYSLFSLVRYLMWALMWTNSGERAGSVQGPPNCLGGNFVALMCALTCWWLFGSWCIKMSNHFPNLILCTFDARDILSNTLFWPIAAFMFAMLLPFLDVFRAFVAMRPRFFSISVSGSWHSLQTIFTHLCWSGISWRTSSSIRPDQACCVHLVYQVKTLFSSGV